MYYTAKTYDHLLGLEGFSNEALTLHFGLYEGYVTNTNKVKELLEQKQEAGEVATPEYAELKRRFGWEWNGMRLHELFFDALTKESTEPSGTIKEKLEEQYRTIDRWKEEFKATASMRGIGWVVLYEDTETGILHNAWITEHDMAHLAGAKVLLVADIFEHAYLLDFKTVRADYIEAYMNAIDWNIVEKRLKA